MVYKQSRHPKSSHLTVLDHALYEPWLSKLMSEHLKTWAHSTNSLILHSRAEPVNKFYNGWPEVSDNEVEYAFV